MKKTALQKWEESQTVKDLDRVDSKMEIVGNKIIVTYQSRINYEANEMNYEQHKNTPFRTFCGR